MPYRPKMSCRHTDYAKLTDGRYCDEHKPLYLEAVRSASVRGYGSKWQKTSKAYLREHPLCAECLKRGKYTQATVVDHVKPHQGNQELFWDRDNWQSLCKHCHDSKTRREDSRPTTTIRI